MIVHEKGFTLIEILAAVVILGIAFAGVVTTHISCINCTRNSICMTRAVVLAQDKMEELKSIGSRHPDLSDTNPSNNSGLSQLDGSEHQESYSDLCSMHALCPTDVSNARYARFWSVADNTPLPGKKTVVVTVTWQSGKKSVSLTSILESALDS